MFVFPVLSMLYPNDTLAGFAKAMNYSMDSMCCMGNKGVGSQGTI